MRQGKKPLRKDWRKSSSADDDYRSDQTETGEPDDDYPSDQAEMGDPGDSHGTSGRGRENFSRSTRTTATPNAQGVFPTTAKCRDSHASYLCPFEACDDYTMEFASKADLQRHIDSAHDVA